MPRYTIQLPADIYIEIEADSEQSVLSKAEQARDEMVEATEFTPPGGTYNGRFYAHEVGLPSIEDID